MVIVLAFDSFCGRDVGQHTFVGKGFNRTGLASVLFRDNEGTLGAAFERNDQPTTGLGRGAKEAVKRLKMAVLAQYELLCVWEIEDKWHLNRSHTKQ